MKTLRTIREVRQELAGGGRIGLVPTMGAFHDGHLALFRAARDECETVVVSLFVNPTQFRALFAPSVEEMYPEGYATWVDVEETGAEGAARPGHFRGVATVCLKLFNIVRPQVAYFGQKDAQQAAVLRRVIRDLDVELDLRFLPTVRDADGLALSSRNAYLSEQERRQALALPRALEAGRSAHVDGSDPVAAARGALNGLVPEYVELLDLGNVTVLAAAARIGTTRLIDNVILESRARVQPGSGVQTKES